MRKWIVLTVAAVAIAATALPATADAAWRRCRGKRCRLAEVRAQLRADGDRFPALKAVGRAAATILPPWRN